jgi:hypothetical protein
VRFNNPTGAAHQMSLAKSQEQLRFAFQDWRCLTTSPNRLHSVNMLYASPIQVPIQLLVFGNHAVCMINKSIPIFGELVDRLQLSLFTFTITK